jgi:phosphatidylglycerol:prolipoprotein diacylglycerol transferase
VKSDIPLPFPIPGPSGPVYSISSFALMLFLAFLSGTLLAGHELKRRGLDPSVSEWATVLAVFGTLIGARIGYVFEIWDRIWIVTDSVSDTLLHLLLYREGMGRKVEGAIGLWDALFSRGGLVFYGGLMVSVLFIYLYLRIRRLDILPYADVFFMVLALGYGIGRMGCLVSGDGCYGYASSISLPFFTMVSGPESAMPSAGVRVWNTPLMEALLSWTLFAWMMWKGRYRAYRPGFFTALFLIWNGLSRFAVEFLRINDAVIPVLPHPQIAGKPLLHHNHWPTNPEAYYFENWHWYGFTQSQLLGAALFLAGLIWMTRSRLYRVASTQSDPSSACTDKVARES